MLKKLKALLGGDKIPENLTKQDEETILKQGSENQRLQLAGRANARPEVLYYLADDSSTAVRQAIAKNPTTPIQADDRLTGDVDDDVRMELARKIGRMLPDLSKSEQDALFEKSLAVLKKLADDQLPKVRAIVAQEIKSSDIVPKDLVEKLARDVEGIVAAPVLEYSPLLKEDDLREIIAAGASSDALTAIARRYRVTEPVSEDIAETLDIPAVSALLTNESAAIREDTLDKIITQAQKAEPLHKPLALRPQLSVRAMKRIAGFVASALVHTMMEKSELEEEDAEVILEAVRDRLESERIEDDEIDQMQKLAQDMFDKGLLDDTFMVDQIEANRRELVIQCLSVLADVPTDAVRRVIHSKSGRAVTALAWKAELKMRTAFLLQTKFALVPSAQLLPGKDGDKYPLDDSELDWHLSYFTDQS